MTSAEIDTDKLPPVWQLVLELLAARARCGEEVWTISKRAARSAVLEAIETTTGLIGWKAGIVEGTNIAWLTDEGRRVMLSANYRPPALSSLDELRAENEALRTALHAMARGVA